jgi:uncharacterized protein YbjQ (UPF0145 family)
MLISTMNDLPGYRVDQVYGEIGNGYQELAAYGTAVVVSKID